MAVISFDDRQQLLNGAAASGAPPGDAELALAEPPAATATGAVAPVSEAEVVGSGRSIAGGLGAARLTALAFAACGAVALALSAPRWAPAGSRSGADGGSGGAMQVPALMGSEIVSEVDASTCAASYKEDCRSKPCCEKFATCFERDSEFAACKATCAMGAPDSAPAWDPDADLNPWNCAVLDHVASAPPSWKPSTASPSLYCFLVTLVQGNEPELMRRHLSSGTGVFGCNEYDMFSERVMIIGPGPNGLVKSTAIGGPMSSSTNNTQDFLRAWRKIASKGSFYKHDWTLKIDPDAVFVAGLIRPKLLKHAVDVEADTVYFKNCKKWHSVQGPLELMSKAASRLFFGHLEECSKDAIIMKVPGEDWFFGHCMDHLNIRFIEDYDLLDDQWCTHKPAACGNGMAVFHPFKTTEGYEACLAKVAV